MGRTKQLFSNEEQQALAVKIVRFFNAAFARKVIGSRALIEAIVSAEDAGYTHDEMRIAFWAARCLDDGDNWLRGVLKSGAGPELVLRHAGHVNPITGKPAKRWLDDLTSRIRETNPAIVGRILNSLPEDMREDEASLLERMEVAYE